NRKSPISNSCAAVKRPASISVCAMRVSAKLLGPWGGGTQLAPLAHTSESVYWPPERCSQLEATIRNSPLVGKVKLVMRDWQRRGLSSSRVSSVPGLPLELAGPNSHKKVSRLAVPLAAHCGFCASIVIVTWPPCWPWKV